ncbi:MAG: putative metal-binding motif-containing protein [Alphaproteobacteria bacterium]|nr:putative metal-binding motif-containing protein [Alphaproteobacteria bacterium]
MMLLALLMPSAQAQDFLQVDAGAPGMAVQVNLMSLGGGFTGAETVTTDCSDIVVGPSVALDRAADPSNPIGGAVLQTVFYIDANATTGQDCIVSIDGTPLSAISSGVDNRFSIVAAEAAPVDGGTNDADGAADGVITISALLRSDGGTVVFESLSVGSGETLWFDTSDPDTSTGGNEAYLPAIVLVQGAANIQGTVDLSGGDGGTPTSSGPTDGGSGAPGGGGGAAGSECISRLTALPGDGFTGGGGHPYSRSTCSVPMDGGVGAIEANDGEHGGEGVFTSVSNAAVGYAGGAGGGTGMFWGTGGTGGYCCGTSGDGGFGGGGGNGHSEASGWGSGGGGFGSDGENGIGTVGGASDSSYRTGGAGYTNGDDSLVPLAGGSGGASGDSGSGSGDSGGGGGGGGGLLLVAESLTLGSSALLDAHGGEGGDAAGANPGSSVGGGAGSGGGLFLAASSVSGLINNSVNVNGGFGGVDSSGNYASGSGGEGRLRVDGTAPPTLNAGPTGASGSTFEGPAITNISGTEISIRSGGPVTLWIYDASGYVTDLSLAEDATEELYDDLPTGGTFYLALVDDNTGVMGPAGVGVIEYSPDLDGDGYIDVAFGGDDCDDSDASVNTGASEVCDGVDNDCDGDVDEDDAADASTWYYDLDGDGYGDADNSYTGCSQPSRSVTDASDCDDANNTISPDADEVCDGVDNDCDGDVDDDDASVDLTTGGEWYADGDGDGFGDPGAALQACAQPSGSVEDDTDCDDGDGAVNPDADEVCDLIDNDCDGEIDEDDATDALTWYADGDGDGYGVERYTTLACDQPSGYAATAGDCDDGDTAFHPGAEESDCADPNDYNCDGSVGYADLDEDGWAACEECDDSLAAVNPDAEEVCDGLDNDCDGTVDGPDAADAGTWNVDADGDGYGDPENLVQACEQPDDAVLDGSDCDDSDESIYPGATEIPEDGVDQDCDGEDLIEGGNIDTGLPDDKGGCDCSSAPRRGSLAWLALLGLAVLRRRRR